ncbi:MAG: hypothetical protein NVSMB32_16510 [Actinomycetota bacterium]
MAIEPDHQSHRYLGEPDEDLIESLEPDQLVRAVDQPVPRRRLSRVASASLWGLRIWLVVVGAMVVYVFVAGVIKGG